MDVAVGSNPPRKTANAAAASSMAGGGGTRPGCGVATGGGRAVISSQGGRTLQMKEEKVRDSSSGVSKGEREKKGI